MQGAEVGQLDGLSVDRAHRRVTASDATHRAVNISLSVAKVDAVTVQSRVAGLVTIVPHVWSRCVASRIRLEDDVGLLP